MRNRKILFATILLILIAVFASCGRDAKKAKPGEKRTGPGGSVVATLTPSEPTSSPTPTSTPTPTTDPMLFRTLSDLYEEEYTEDLYHIGSDWKIEGGYLYSGSVRDGYVMMVQSARLGDGDYKVCYSLFPILGPERITTGYIPEVNDYMLGQDGTVYGFRSDGTVIQRKKYRDRDATWSFGEDVYRIGISKDETLWVVGDGFLAGYNFETGKEERYEGFQKLYDDRILSEEDGAIIFSLHNKYNVQRMYRLDRKTGEIALYEESVGHAEFYEGTILYDSQERFYVAPLDTPELIGSYEKKREAESVLMCKGGRFLTYCYENAGDGEDYDYIDYYRVVDARSGAVYGELATDLFLDRYWTIQYMGITEEGYFLFTAYGEDDEEELYLYDFSKRMPETDPTFRRYRPADENPEAYAIARRMEEEFPGVRVYYDKFGLDFFRDSYLLTPCEDNDTLIEYMLRLEEFLMRYPAGFLQELSGEKKTGLDIFLCGGFVRISDSSIETPAACANRYRDRLALCMGVVYLSSLEQNVVHELTHLSEHRIEEYEEANDCHILGYWDVNLNSPDYPYKNSYLDENGMMISDYSGTTIADANNAWFIDAYAKSAPTEDRARVLEYLYLGYDWDFQSEGLRNKAKFLTAALREVFPSVAACDYPVLWEQMFGVISFDDYRELVKNLND